MAELIGGALLGKVEIEAGLGLNMLIILVDTKIFLPENLLGSNVKSILDEIRSEIFWFFLLVFPQNERKTY